MSVSGMSWRSAFRGLMPKGARWRAALVLAAILSGAIGGQAGAAPASAGVTGVGATSAVLRQAGSTWVTTVLVTGTGSGCTQAKAAGYWLATTPYGALGGPGLPGSKGTVTGTAPGGSADACEVTVTFSGLAHVPTTAALVIDQAGASSSVTLTVSRDVTLTSYLGVPAAAGGIAVLLYLLSLFFVKTYDWQDGTHRPLAAGWRAHLRHPFDPAWWKHSVPGSGAWTAGDSWATNISTGLVVVSTFLAATTASSSLFPGVALDRFAMANIVAGVFVVAAPVVFGILYAYLTGRDPGPSADSVVRVRPPGKVVLRMPSGGTLAPVVQTTVNGAPAGALPSVNAGSAYPVAPGSVISISPPAPAEGAAPDPVAIAFSGTSDIGVLPGATVDIVPEPDPFHAGSVPASDPPFSLSPAGGAKITVTGAGGVYLPQGSVVTGPRRRDGLPARAGRWLLVPQGSTVIVGTLGVIVAANILTIFGIGAELGIAFVLARFSDAGSGWSGGGIYAGLAALAVVVLCYAVSATRAMANPQPGSALSAQAGTSFTL
jgi:hypothetical protein